MHLCICASSSNGVIVSLGLFTLDYKLRLARAIFRLIYTSADRRTQTFVICLWRNRRVREQDWDCNKDPVLKRQTTVGE